MAFYHLFEDVLAVSGPVDTRELSTPPLSTRHPDHAHPPEEPCLPSCAVPLCDLPWS